MKPIRFIILLLMIIPLSISAQKKKSKTDSDILKVDEAQFKGLKFRNIGPFRGGRSIASSGVVSYTLNKFIGNTSGGVLKK